MGINLLLCYFLYDIILKVRPIFHEAYISLLLNTLLEKHLCTIYGQFVRSKSL
jgi:hypothetical protein